jgi:hypothetical protein
MLAVCLLLTSYHYLITFTLFNSPQKTFLGRLFALLGRPTTFPGMSISLLGRFTYGISR